MLANRVLLLLVLLLLVLFQILLLLLLFLVGAGPGPALLAFETSPQRILLPEWNRRSSSWAQVPDIPDCSPCAPWNVWPRPTWSCTIGWCRRDSSSTRRPMPSISASPTCRDAIQSVGLIFTPP